MGRRGGTGLGSEVFLALCLLSSAVTFPGSCPDDGKQRAAELPEKRFCM